MLVDGGALNNLPVDVAKEMGADVIICVDLSTGWKKKEELKSASSVVEQAHKYDGAEQIPEEYG